MLPKPIRERLPALPALAVDAGIALFAAVIGIVQIVGAPRRGGFGGSLGTNWEDIVLVVFASACLLLRSRWPVATLVGVGGIAAGYFASDGPPFPILPSVLVSLYGAIAYTNRPRWQAWTMAIVVCGVMAIGLAIGEPRGRPLSAWAGDLAWISFAILLGEAMRGRRDVAHEAQLRAVQAELTRDLEARRRVSDERLQIARELHDIVAHNLALINVQAGVAAHVMDQHPEQAREAFRNIKEASHTTLQELRSLLRVLRDPESGATAMMPTVGLDALDQLIASVRDAGVPIEVERHNLEGELPATIDLAAYRILQEALTNVVKHTAHAPVRVILDRSAGALTVRVVNGPGNGPVARGAGTGSGIEGMRERVTALGGTLEAGPSADGGFNVRATLPVPA